MCSKELSGVKNAALDSEDKPLIQKQMKTNNKI